MPIHSDTDYSFSRLIFNNACIHDPQERIEECFAGYFK